MKRYNLVILLLVLVLVLSSCNAPKYDKPKIHDDGMTDEERREYNRKRDEEESLLEKKLQREADETIRKAFMDFGIKTIKAAKKDGENIVVSPMAIISAITMVSLGGDYDEESATMVQIQKTLGYRVESLTTHFSDYYSNIDSGMTFANSIWVKDKLAKKLNYRFVYSNKD